MKVSSGTLPPPRRLPRAPRLARFSRTLSAIPFLLTFFLSSCATHHQAIFPTAMDAPDGRFPDAGDEDSQQRYLPRGRGVSKLSPYQRDILRIGKENYSSYLGVSGWDRGLYYTGRIRVYRWGKHREVPLDQYDWDAAAGERWHVVREASSGIAGLNVGSGMNPLSGYHTARKLTLSIAGTRVPPSPLLEEPDAPEVPAPRPIQLDGPVLTQTSEDEI